MPSIECRARAQHEGVFGAQAGAPLLDRQLAIALAGRESPCAPAGPRALDAQRIQQLLAQLGKGTRMQQQHALLVQPDVAGARVEAQERKKFSHVVSPCMKTGCRCDAMLSAASAVKSPRKTRVGRLRDPVAVHLAQPRLQELADPGAWEWSRPIRSRRAAGNAPASTAGIRAAPRRRPRRPDGGPTTSGRSPHPGCAIATTEASATAGWPMTRFSISTEADPFAARLDHVLAAVDQMHVAVGVDGADVAGAQPAVGGELARVVRRRVVAARDPRPAHLHFARRLAVPGLQARRPRRRCASRPAAWRCPAWRAAHAAPRRAARDAWA